MNRQMRSFPIPEGLEGMRADAALAKLLGLSRSATAQLCAEGSVTIDSQELGKSERLISGNVVSVLLPEPEKPLLPREEYTERLQAANPKSTARIEGLDGLVVLDTEVTEELEAEGWAADVIRGLQDARKASGFEVSDRIAAVLSVPEEKKAWAERHADHIAGEVLATDFQVTTEALDGADVHEVVKGVSATVVKQ